MPAENLNRPKIAEGAKKGYLLASDNNRVHSSFSGNWENCGDESPKNSEDKKRNRDNASFLGSFYYN